MSTHFTDEELGHYYESAKRTGSNRVLAAQFVAALVFVVVQT